MKKYFFILILIPMVAYTVEGGFQLKDQQWDGVVHLKSKTGFCSGALINQQWVLTAAHCVDKKNNQEISIFSGLKADNFLSKAHLAFIDPRYSPQYANYDVALLKLTNKVKSPNNLKISASKIYSYLLNGKYPPRKVLVAGYGLDEYNKLGTRKGAFENDLGIYPGEMYIGSFFTKNSIGKTRPGDSGGPIFILTPEGHQLFGVVSGKNSYTIRDEDGDIKEHAIRNAPLASSLCLLDSTTQKAIQFDSSYCEKIKQAESRLSNPPQTKEDHLWQAALAAGSPLHEVDIVRDGVIKLVANSFAQIDSLMARRYIKENLKTTNFIEREVRKLIRDTLNDYEGRTGNNRYATSDTEKMNANILRWSIVEPIEDSKNIQLAEQCGDSPCLELWRTSEYIDFKYFGNTELNWDYLTLNDKKAVGFDIKKLICACSENNGTSDRDQIINILNMNDFSSEFIEVTNYYDGLKFKSQSSRQSVELRCGKDIQNNQKIVYADISLDKKLNFIDIDTLINKSKQNNQLTIEERPSKTLIKIKNNLQNMQEKLTFHKEYNAITINIRTFLIVHNSSNSVLINEVFQCN